MRFFKLFSRPKTISQEGAHPPKLYFFPILQDSRLQALVYFLIAIMHLSLIFAPFMQRLEFVFLDAFFRHRPALVSSPQIVFVEIAQDSIDKIGRWPWPRRYHAALLSILSQWQVHGVVFDAFFSEASLDAFDDKAFSEALSKTKNDYAGSVLEDSTAFNSDVKKKSNKVWVHSIPEIERHLRGVGHVNITPDLDGITRHVELNLSENGESHSYLGAAVAKDYLADSGRVYDEKKIPLDHQGRMLINWVDRWEKSYRHYSYWDVLQSYAAIQKNEKPIVSPEELKGKIVLIGVTASGLTDIKGVPLQAIFPGVGVIANVMNSVLTNQFTREASPKENAAIILMIAFCLAFLFLKSSKEFAWTAVLTASVAWVAIAFVVFCQLNIFFQVLNPLLLFLSFFMFSNLIGFLRNQNEQSILYQLATRDGLTGLYTIRHMRSLLESSILRCRKYARPLSVLMTDVDFFKKVNDSLGHDAGDMVLKNLARLLELHFSELNETSCFIRVGRYGGEEFLVLIEGYASHAAKTQFAESLRKRVELFQFHYQGQKIPVTISIGLAELRAEDVSLDEIIKRADEALYRAKRAGRNRVEIG